MNNDMNPQPDNNNSSNMSPNIVKLSDYAKNNDLNEQKNTDKVMPAVNQSNNMSSGSTPTKDTTQPKKKTNLAMILGMIVLFLIVVGAGAGFYLTQYVNQDIRQQAYDSQSCGRVSCANGNSGEYDCNVTTFPSCEARAAEICGVNDCSQETCDGDNCTKQCTLSAAPAECNNGCECPGTCSYTGCSYNCPSGCSEPKPEYARCTGNRNSTSCNSAIDGYVSLGSPPDYNNPENWCKVFQFDSNAPNGSNSVVWVGDNGKICYNQNGGPNKDEEGKPCNPQELDWDCSNPTPSANLSAVCEPAEQTIGNLQYRLSFNNISPSPSEVEYSKTSYWLCMDLNDTQFGQTNVFRTIYEDFFNSNADWTGGSSVCYLIEEKDAQLKDEPFRLFVNGTKRIGQINPDLIALNKNINQLAVFVESTFPEFYEDITFRFQGQLQLANGNSTDSPHANRVPIHPYACAKTVAQCQDIALVDESLNPISQQDLSIGQQVGLRCYATQGDVHHYEFKVTTPTTTLQGTQINPAGSSQFSKLFELDAGKYEASCRVCTSATECGDFVTIGD